MKSILLPHRSGGFSTLLGILVLALIGLLGYWLLYPETAPAFIKARWVQEFQPQASRERQLYRWRDAQGNWQISDQPPPNPATQYETVNISLDANVVPSDIRVNLDEEGTPVIDNAN